MLTPRERVLTALRHEEPDRVPTGECEFSHAIVSPVIAETTYRNQRATMQALWERRRDEVAADCKVGLVKMVEQYGWDLVFAHTLPGRDTPIEVPRPLGPSIWRDSLGRLVRYSPETDYFAAVEHILPPAAMAATGQPALQRMDLTDCELELVRHVVRQLGATHFVVAEPLCPAPLPRPRYFGYADATHYELDDWVSVFEDPDAVASARLAAITAPHVERGIERARQEGIDAIFYGHDYGCNSRPFLSPALFRRAIFPALKTYVNMVHRHGLFFIHHSCGYNLPLLDMLVEAGVDVYQAIQPEMNLAQLKRRYGANLSFWGGVAAGLLVTGSPASVRLAGRQALADGMPGGGFIYATSHSVLPGSKPENYNAMLAALQAYGCYGTKGHA